jgi:ABC-type amino acid transport substrate-binding protein
MRVALLYHRARWSTILDELTAGTVDAVCSAATVTDERRRVVDFCTPHLRLTLAVVTRRGDPAGTAIQGRRIGVRTGTTAEAWARAAEPRAISLSESNDALYAALATGGVEAVVDDSPIAAHFSHAVEGLQFAGALPNTDGAYGIMIRKGNVALLDTLNAALAALDADGTMERLRARWHCY